MRLLFGHFAAMATFGILAFQLYGGNWWKGQTTWIAALWLGSGLSGILLASWAVLPLRSWLRLIRETGSLWAQAGVAVVAACAVGLASQSLWQPATQLTFRMVELFLRPFVSGIQSDPAQFSIGTKAFWVVIAPQCSGLEGAGLMLAFGVTWLWLFRHECRFPRALLLVPAGIAVMFVLNAVRIAALILIGNAGARQIAEGGFHSQAGWIAFNLVAVGFCLAAVRLPWVIQQQDRAPSVAAAPNATTAYLVPFLAILAAG